MSNYNKIGQHQTSVVEDSNKTVVRYHSTDVVTIDRSKGTITLDHGGWMSATTKVRMNQTSREYDLGIWVFSDKGQWFVDLGNGYSVNYPATNEFTFALAMEDRRKIMEAALIKAWGK